LLVARVRGELVAERVRPGGWARKRPDAAADERRIIVERRRCGGDKNASSVVAEIDGRDVADRCGVYGFADLTSGVGVPEPQCVIER
jgi:hypothetical protein